MVNVFTPLFFSAREEEEEEEEDDDDDDNDVVGLVPEDNVRSSS